MSSWGLSKYIEIKLQTTYFYLILTFLKKQSLELVSLTNVLHNFWRKTFLSFYPINWPSFIVWLPLLREILDNMCIAILC